MRPLQPRGTNVKETPPSKKTTHKRWSNLAVCFACLFSLGTAQAEETTVEIIHYFNVKDQQDGLSEIITDFQQKNPDIKVQLTYVPFPELVSRTLQTAAV